MCEFLSLCDVLVVFYEFVCVLDVVRVFEFLFDKVWEFREFLYGEEYRRRSDVFF